MDGLDFTFQVILFLSVMSYTNILVISIIFSKKRKIFKIVYFNRNETFSETLYKKFITNVNDRSFPM